MDADVLHDNVAGGIADDTHLVLVLADGDAGELHVHDEHGDAAAAALGGIGLGVNNAVICKGSAGNEGLAAVQDVVIAVRNCGGLRAAGIGTGAGLGQTESNDLLTGRAGGQVLLLLLFGAEVEQGAAAEGVGRVRVNGEHDTSAGQLFDHDGIRQIVAALAAVSDRDLHAGESSLCHLVKDLSVELAGCFQFIAQLRGELSLCKLTEELSHHLMFFVKNHCFSSI